MKIIHNIPATLLIALLLFSCNQKKEYSMNGVATSNWDEKEIERQIIVVDSLSASGALDYTQELLKYDSLVRIANKFNLKEGLQNIYRRYGTVYMNLDSLIKSTDYLIQSAQISTEIKDTLALLSTLSNIGNVYQHFELTNKALLYLDSAHKGYLKEGFHPIYLRNSFYNLSGIYSNLKDHPKAAAFAKQSFLRIKSIPKKDAYLKADSIYYWLQWMKELSIFNKTAARDSFTNMLPVIQIQSNNTIKLESYALGINLFPASISADWLDSIQYFIEKEEANDIKLSAYINLIEYYKRNQQIDSAFKYQEITTAYNDSTNNLEKLKTIANVTSSFEQLSNEKILRLEAQKKLKNNWLTGLTIMLFLLFIAGLFYFQNLKNRRKKAIAEKNLDINKLLEDINQTKMEAWAEGQEKERSRIANELHDRLGGVLAMASHHFDKVEEQFEQMKKQNNSAVIDLKKLLNNAIIEVRELSKDISSNLVNKLGLSNALIELGTTVQNASKLDISLKTHDADFKIPVNKEIALYRVAQEALNNIMKHAQASAVEISLVSNNTSLVLMIEDNGVGFNPETIQLTIGLGLRSMRKRTEDLKGTFNIDSKKERGTILIAEIPF